MGRDCTGGMDHYLPFANPFSDREPSMKGAAMLVRTLAEKENLLRMWTRQELKRSGTPESKIHRKDNEHTHTQLNTNAIYSLKPSADLPGHISLFLPHHLHPSSSSLLHSVPWVIVCKPRCTPVRAFFAKLMAFSGQGQK